MEETPELAQVRAFAETAFPMLVKRMPTERVAKVVGQLALRWGVAGHNVLTLAGALHAELAVKCEVDHMLGLMVAWEEMDDCQYDPALGRFVKQTRKRRY